MTEVIPTKLAVGDGDTETPLIHPVTLPHEQPQNPIPLEIIALYPFDDQSADIILSSSDKVLFYVHKSILIYASGFFHDLFVIGLNVDADVAYAKQSQSPSAPTIGVSENSIILGQVLHWCYPIPHTEPTTIETIESILTVAVKYDMAGVMFYMRRPLQNLDDTCAIPLFALSCHFGFSDLAEDSAKMLRDQYAQLADVSQSSDWNATITHAIYTSKVASIRAASFLRLLQFVRDGEKPLDFSEPVEPNTGATQEVYTPIMICFSDGDLIVRSQLDTSVEFKVHRQIISFSSPVLKEKIQSIAGLSEGLDAIPTLELPEGSTNLSLLLISCYPSDSSDLPAFDPSDIPVFVESANKYGLKRAKTLRRKFLAELALIEPFRAYHISVKCDWKEEAQNAAVQLARLWIEEQYHPSMENMDAGQYYPLLKFCHEYRKILYSIRQSTSLDGTPTLPEMLSNYNRMWQCTGHRYVQDAASILSLPGMPSFRGNPLLYVPGSSTNIVLMQQLLKGYQSIAKQLNELKIPWEDGYGKQHAAPIVRKKKLKKGRR